MRARIVLALVVLAAACSDTGVVDGDGTHVSSSTSAPASGDLWRPRPGTTWQWQLSGEIDGSHDVAMYDVDLFDVPLDTIARLHDDGRVVVCYFSAGSVEEWRPDAAEFRSDVVGLPLDGWPGERWVDVRAIDVVGPVLEARLDLAIEKECDGVEPDNVDAHLNETGFDVTAGDQLTFNRWLAGEAHRRGLSVGLKNDLAQAEKLVGDFDWLLVEECVEFAECDGVESFVAAGKAVFAAEYADNSDEACTIADEVGMSLIFATLDLDGRTSRCP